MTKTRQRVAVGAIALIALVLRVYGIQYRAAVGL